MKWKTSAEFKLNEGKKQKVCVFDEKEIQRKYK